MSERFEPGELVNVRIDAVRYDSTHSDGDHMVVFGENFFINVPASAVIERVAPKGWPPQVGDVWTDAAGTEWFAFAPGNGERLTLRPDRDMAFWAKPDDLLASHSPVRLVRRRGWTPEPPPAVEPTPEQALRAERVAGLRAFADLIESRPDVPVPYSINGQVGFAGPDGLAEALRVAATLGIELDPIRDTGHEIQRWARSGKLDLGGDVTLTLYAHGLDAPQPDPTEVGGETVEDDGPAS